jgi:hypothetical protein
MGPHVNIFLQGGTKNGEEKESKEEKDKEESNKEKSQEEKEIGDLESRYSLKAIIFCDGFLFCL